MNIAQRIETFRVEAANAVLGRLGDSMFSILRDELETCHGIRLNVGANFTLDQISAALRDLVGAGAAQWLMTEIENEIDFLSGDPYLEGRRIIESQNY